MNNFPRTLVTQSMGTIKHEGKGEGLYSIYPALSRGGEGYGTGLCFRGSPALGAKLLV